VTVYTHSRSSLNRTQVKCKIQDYIKFANMVDTFTLLGLTITFPTSNRMASFPIPSSPNRNHRRCYSNPNPHPPHPQPALLVFSGGTAFNGVVEDLKNFTTRVAHVLPVSDDGGSTAEIVRVLGISTLLIINHLIN